MRCGAAIDFKCYWWLKIGRLEGEENEQQHKIRINFQIDGWNLNRWLSPLKIMQFHQQTCFDSHGRQLHASIPPTNKSIKSINLRLVFWREHIFHPSKSNANRSLNDFYCLNFDFFCWTKERRIKTRNEIRLHSKEKQQNQNYASNSTCWIWPNRCKSESRYKSARLCEWIKKKTM